MTVVTMRFTYSIDPPGMIRELINWKESAKYIEGVDVSDHRVKTFRKDRVRDYLDGAAALLRDPWPEPALFEVQPGRAPDLRTHIIFTGFAKVQRAALEARAEAAGMRVCKTVTKTCLYLVAGPNAGPSKVANARELNAYILNERQFHALLNTGELPDDPDSCLTDC